MTLESRIAAWRRREAERYAGNEYPDEDESDQSIAYLGFLAGMEAAAKVETLIGKIETYRLNESNLSFAVEGIPEVIEALEEQLEKLLEAP